MQRSIASSGLFLFVCYDHVLLHSVNRCHLSPFGLIAVEYAFSAPAFVLPHLLAAWYLGHFGFEKANCGAQILEQGRRSIWPAYVNCLCNLALGRRSVTISW